MTSNNVFSFYAIWFILYLVSMTMTYDTSQENDATILPYFEGDIHTYIYTYTHTYTNTHIHTLIHTYINEYIN
jgi:hypothetical protein